MVHTEYHQRSRMFTDKSRSLRNGTMRAILDRTMYGPNSPFAPALRTLSYAGQFQVGEAVEGGEEGDFPAVSGFTFTQVDNTDFEYNWGPFTNDRVIYIEISWDGVSWDFFTWVESNETGPYQQTAWTIGGWPEAGNDFVPGNVYYLRARYQDAYPTATLFGNFTELSFVAAGGGESLPAIPDLVLVSYDESEAELTWTPSGTYTTYIEATNDNGEFVLYNWYDPGDGGNEFYTHTDLGGSPAAFKYGQDYSIRFRYQNAPGNGTPTEIGPWSTETFTADVIPYAQVGFSVQQAGTTYDLFWQDQPNLFIRVSLTVDGVPMGEVFDSSAGSGTGVYDSGEGWSVGQQLGFSAIFYIPGDPDVLGPSFGTFTITVV